MKKRVQTGKEASEEQEFKMWISITQAAGKMRITRSYHIPGALHSSSNFRRLCSGALMEGKIMRLEVAGLCLVPAVDSDSIDPLSFMMGRSVLLRTVADTRSFQILPS